MLTDLVGSIVRDAKLSTTEHAVLFELLLGKPRKEAADDLNMSVDTFKSHVRSIFRKAGVRNRFELLERFLTPLRTRH